MVGTPNIRARRAKAERGVVSLEVVLSLPVIFVALGGAMFVTTYMKQRAVVDALVHNSVRLCARGVSDAGAQACVAGRINAGTDVCTALNVEAQVEAFDNPYVEPELLNPVTKRLSLLRAEVACTMEVKMPLFDIGELEFRSQAAMPMRLETEAMP